MAENEQRDLNRFIVRMPEGMRDRIREAAEAANRSMNAEIVSRLALTLDENVWERQKFINLLNYKQLTIDKCFHAMSSASRDVAKAKQAVKYERSLREAMGHNLQLLCHAAIEEPGLSEGFKNLAKIFLNSGYASLYVNENDINDDELHRKIGDRDEVDENWEDTLSNEDKELLKTAREWSLPHE